MALVLLRERTATGRGNGEVNGDESGGSGSRTSGGPWGPYMDQLPDEYDLLGMWSDEQLKELQCPDLIKAAWAQRVENIKAFEAVQEAAGALGDGSWLSTLSHADVAWGLNTVRSRSFLGKYPEGDALPPFQGMTSISGCEDDGSEDDAATSDGVSSSGGDDDGGGGISISNGATYVNTAEEEEEEGGGGVGGGENIQQQEQQQQRQEAEYPSTFVLPFLDAFNHRSDGTTAGGATRLRYDAAAAAFELTSKTSLAPGDEATISYGKRSNDELLLRFGFCVEGNRDEVVRLPGCMAELDWLIPGTDRERDMKRDGLVSAVKSAHVDSNGRASTNLLWALRVLLATDEEFAAAGGSKGLKMTLPTRDGDGSLDYLGPHAAAEAALALACEEELRVMNDSKLEHWEEKGPLVYDLEEDEIKLAAARMVANEVAREVAEDACAVVGEGNTSADGGGAGGEGGGGGGEEEEYARDACESDLDADVENLRRLVTALTHRVNRKRLLYACLEKYKPRG